MREMFKDKVNRSQTSETLAEFWTLLFICSQRRLDYLAYQPFDNEGT
jgi:hypothetical protein